MCVFERKREREEGTCNTWCMNSYIVINFLKTGKIRTSADEENVIAVLLAHGE